MRGKVGKSELDTFNGALQKRSKDFGLGGSASFELLSFLSLWQEVYQLLRNFVPKSQTTQKQKTCRTSIQSLFSSGTCAVSIIGPLVVVVLQYQCQNWTLFRLPKTSDKGFPFSNDCEAPINEGCITTVTFQSLTSSAIFLHS